MAFRVRNPNFVPPSKGKVDGAKAAVTAFLAGRGQAIEFVTFDDIKAAVPALAGEPDGVIYQVLADLGHDVIS